MLQACSEEQNSKIEEEGEEEKEEDLFDLNLSVL